MKDEREAEIKTTTPKNSLGCGAKVMIHTNTGFVCGVPNAWGKENLCDGCKDKRGIRN